MEDQFPAPDPGDETVPLTIADQEAEDHGAQAPEKHGRGPGRLSRRLWRALVHLFLALLIFSGGLGSGYALWGRQLPEEDLRQAEARKAVEAIYPEDGHDTMAHFNDAGPKLIEAGAIDLEGFKQVYEQAGMPLTEQDLRILTAGGEDTVRFTRENAHFLLNFFWALGLANKNPILDSGPIQQASKGKIETFASTGGWPLASKPITEVFSGTEIITLSKEQQARLEAVAQAVYRPCCNNPTHFPDCNHGMAMLGLLELMASQDASTEQMFTAAKYANAYWYPQQTQEQAVFFKAKLKQDFAQVDPQVLLSPQVSSGSGFQNVHQYMSQNGYLESSPQGGSSCGV